MTYSTVNPASVNPIGASRYGLLTQPPDAGDEGLDLALKKARVAFLDGAADDTTSVGNHPSPAAQPPRRRQYSTSDKREILCLYDAIPYGRQGEFLRSRGLRHSHISNWRNQVAKFDEAALAPKKRGRKSQQTDKLNDKLLVGNKRLKRDNSELRRKLRLLNRDLEKLAYCLRYGHKLPRGRLRQLVYMVWCPSPEKKGAS